MPPSPDVWTDGSLVRDEVSGSACAGAGVYARLHADNWRYRRWGHFDDLGLTPDGLSSSCLGFCSLPGPLQTVQRAEFWGVVLALQATSAVHLGVDDLNVVRYVGRLLDGMSTVRPFELVDDGDLVNLILLFCSCIVSLLPSLVLSSIVMILLALPLILLFGLLGAFLRSAVLLILFEMLLWFQVLFVSWVLAGLVFFLLLLLLRMLVFGRSLLIS